ncbi:hypothetical protein HK100_003101 [Physocladia obscura]|uniref:Uncharacterized protein n=1 Tax=Physocladia obscura TaxID=109957 RepID=A0AAD5XEX8_9FUNG|nr:hypothetical protein HK100_003101 [Physocladia obscura]
MSPDTDFGFETAGFCGCGFADTAGGGGGGSSEKEECWVAGMAPRKRSVAVAASEGAIDARSGLLIVLSARADMLSAVSVVDADTPALLRVRANPICAKFI